MDSQAELVHSVTYFPQWIDNSNYDNDNLMNNTFSGNDHSQSKQFKIKLKANVMWLAMSEDHLGAILIIFTKSVPM